MVKIGDIITINFTDNEITTLLELIVERKKYFLENKEEDKWVGGSRVTYFSTLEQKLIILREEIQKQESKEIQE